jgi:ubiquinone/menaquinone biosynthesis C-methylase UbiE
MIAASQALPMTVGIKNNLKLIYEEIYKGNGRPEWGWIASEHKAKNVLELCKDIKPDKIIDIGAGQGSLLARLDQAGFGNELYGVDVAQNSIDAIKRLGISKLIEARLFDGYHTNYEDKQFDLALLTHVLEHVEHPLLLLKEINRITKYMYIECPLEFNYQGKKDIGNARKYGHINIFDDLLLTMLITNADFKILNYKIFNSELKIYLYCSRNAGYIKYAIKEIALNIVPGLAKKMFIYNYCALAKPLD